MIGLFNEGNIMIRSYGEYIQRGGTQAALAEKWEVSPAMVNKTVKKHGGSIMVDFNPVNPRLVKSMWIIQSPKKILF
jgi:hypothetical protein